MAITGPQNSKIILVLMYVIAILLFTSTFIIGAMRWYHILPRMLFHGLQLGEGHGRLSLVCNRFHHSI